MSDQRRPTSGAWITRVMAAIADTFRPPERAMNLALVASDHHKFMLEQLRLAQQITERMKAECGERPAQPHPDVYTGPLRRARRDKK